MKSITATLWLVVALIGLSSSSLLADLVIETRANGQNTGMYFDTGFSGNSSVSASVSPATGGIGCRYSTTSSTYTFGLTPTLAVGHTYALMHALPAGATSSSQTLTNALTVTGCTGLPATTDVFKYPGAPTSSWLNCWRTIGTLTASTANPTITFTWSSGNACRTTVAAFWLQDLACQTPGVNVEGAVMEGQTVVNVAGVALNATAVYVYTNYDGSQTHATCIGTNSNPGGLSTVPVTVFPLVRGTHLQATQLRGCEREPAAGTTGPTVGAGTNGAVMVCFDVSQTDHGGDFVWLSATGVNGGYAAPPLGATVINPSVGWQTLTVTPGVDPAYMWNNTPAAYAWPYGFGMATNVSIWFAPNDPTESGPYTVYLDNFRSGSTVLRGFDADADGTSTFMARSAVGVGTTSLDTGTDTTLCVSSNAAVGAKCQRLDWQWTGVAAPNSVRGMCLSPAPIVDLNQTISVDVLVLPAGATVPALQLSQPPNIILSNSIAASTAKVTATENSTAYYGATSVTLAYQWQHNGVNIDAGNAGDRTGYNSDTLSFTAPVAADAGTYTCVVTDTVGGGTYPGTYTSKASLVATFLDPIPVIITQPAAKTILNVGSPLNLSVTAAPLFAGGAPLSYQWQLNGAAINNATASSYTVNPAAVSDAGSYDVIVMNAFLPAGVASTVAIVDVVAADVVVGTGTGLQGDYYTLHTNGIPGTVPDQGFSGAATLSRTDATVDSNWLAGSPDASISAENFTARWYGQVEALDTDTYTFYVASDDGARLWVNGQLVIDKWVLQGGTENSGTIALTKNTKYPIVLEYFEHTGGARAHLRWSGAGGGVVKEIIPTSQLYAGTTYTLPTVALTAPANGSSVTLPAQVTASATVAANDGIVKAVEFYANNVMLISVAAPGPYTYTWTAPVGANAVRAAVLYNEEWRAYSGTTNTVTVNPNPTSPVTITSITASAINYTGGAGLQFVLMSTNALSGPVMPHAGWQPVATNTITPSSFPITPSSTTFYYIESR